MWRSPPRARLQIERCIDMACYVISDDGVIGVTTGVTAAATTWDAATVASVTLSAGDLVASNTGTTATNQGARAPSSAGKTSGKWYFEFTFTTAVGATTSDLGAGIGTTGSAYTGIGPSATIGVILYKAGTVWA